MGRTAEGALAVLGGCALMATVNTFPADQRNARILVLAVGASMIVFGFGWIYVRVWGRHEPKVLALEVRHSQEQPYRIVETPDRYTWHHIGVGNPTGNPLADNVRVRLKRMTKPRTTTFRGNFPHYAPLKDSKETVTRISPGDEAHFRLATTWLSGEDNAPMVAGLDGTWMEGKQEVALRLDSDETWRLDCEITSSVGPPEPFTVVFRVDAANLVHCELIVRREDSTRHTDSAIGRRPLQPRYDQTPRYRHPKPGVEWITQHRIGIHNPRENPPVDRARIYLKDMTPHPRKDGGRPPVIPYFVPMVVEGDPGIGLTLGSGREEPWVLGYTAKGGDGTMNAGYFAVHNQQWNGLPWVLEQDERWRLIYRIVSEGNADVEFSIVVTPRDGEIRLDLEG